MDKNNFDSVRICLAFIVFLFHIYFLTKIQELQWISYIFNPNFAVKGFFVISGFLVMKSYTTSTSNLEYAEKRFRRIFPAYISAVLLSLCIGIFASDLSPIDFLKSNQTLNYFYTNAVFMNFIQPELPFTFLDNPLQAVNGSLWTIKIEVMLYVCIPLIFYLFKKIGSIKSTLSLTLISIYFVYFFTYIYHGSYGLEIARQFPGQLSFFILGAFFFVNIKKLSCIKWAAFISFILLVLINDPYKRLFLEPLCYSIIVIYLSTSAFRNLNLGKFGDISYGIYLYHFPIIQFLIFSHVFEFNLWFGFFMAIFLTLLAASISWHLIEKRFLKKASHYLHIKSTPWH